MALLYLGGIVLAIMFKLKIGPFATPVLLNTYVVTQKVTTFDLNPICQKVAFVRITDHAYVRVPHEVRVTIIDQIARKSCSVKGLLFWGDTKLVTNMKTSGQCSITVEIDSCDTQMTVDVFGFNGTEQ